MSTKDFAFLPIDLHLEFSLKETADTCYHPMSSTFRLDQEPTGGIRSIQFFNAPRDVAPAIAVEEVFKGTGHYYIQYSIYSLVNGKISKLWDHTKLERNFVIPNKDGVVDLFEFDPSGPPEQIWRKMVVEGVRKVYPVNKNGFSDFRVEKLPKESYCWDHDKRTYLDCK